MRRAHLDAVVASEVEKSVLQHTTVTRGEDEAVTVEPVRVLRVVPHDLVVQHVTHRGAAHGQTRVTRIRLLDGVDREEPDRVDRLLDQRGVGGLAHRGLDGDGLDCAGSGPGWAGQGSASAVGGAAGGGDERGGGGGGGGGGFEAGESGEGDAVGGGLGGAMVERGGAGQKSLGQGQRCRGSHGSTSKKKKKRDFQRERERVELMMESPRCVVIYAISSNMSWETKKNNNVMKVRERADRQIQLKKQSQPLTVGRKCLPFIFVFRWGVILDYFILFWFNVESLNLGLVCFKRKKHLGLVKAQYFI